VFFALMWPREFLPCGCQAPENTEAGKEFSMREILKRTDRRIVQCTIVDGSEYSWAQLPTGWQFEVLVRVRVDHDRTRGRKHHFVLRRM
jgi:hypothetical protein